MKGEQKHKVSVITSDRHMIMERHWPKDTADAFQGRLQWRGEQVKVGVVRGKRVGEAAGGYATRNGKNFK